MHRRVTRSGFLTPGGGIGPQPVAPPIRIPPPALVVAEPVELGQLIAVASASANVEITVPPAVMPEQTVWYDLDEDRDVRRDDRRPAKPEDWNYVLTPITLGTSAFAVVAAFSDPRTGAVWGLAVFLITIIAMRDEQIGQWVAWLADRLKPPER